jgi:hypothetical protein
MTKVHRGTFKPGSDRAREAGRKGGKVSAARRRAKEAPYDGTILDVMDAAGLTGPSWEPWRAFWRAVHGLGMDGEALDLYRAHTERENAPEEPVSEAWMPIGRRGGKSRNAAIAALYAAISFDSSTLAPGELAVIPVLCPDRRQGRVVLGYLRGLLELPDFAPYLHRTLKETVELHCGVNIEIATASFRTIRGYTVPAAVLDEVAFWYDDGANPDSEVLQALRPAMATVPGSLLLGLSSPYACRGELYKAVETYFGQDDPRVLVWNADTGSMNPEVPQHVIARAFEDDPVAAASEYGQDGRVQFRRDVEAFLDPAAVAAVTAGNRLELPPMKDTRYVAFVDPSGGSQDSFTLAIAHREGDLAVLDAVRERRPPFSPDDVVQEFAELLETYQVRIVVGDRYGGEWPRERFQVHGIRYEPSERTKSDLYRELVAPVNGGRVTLLDLPVLRSQLIGLERRVARGGRDSIDHAPGGRDDVANAVAGALGLVLQRSGAVEPGFH